MGNKNFKMGKILECFTKEDIQIVNKHMKRCLTSNALGNCKLKQQCDAYTHLF